MHLGAPALITVVADKLVVSSSQGLLVLNRTNGETAWAKEMVNQAELLVEPAGIRIVGKNHSRETVSFEGTTVARLRVPIFTPYFKLLHFAGNEQRMFVIANRYMGESDDPDPEGLVLRAYDPSEQDVLWDTQYEDELAEGFAVSPDRKTCYAATQSDVYVIPVAAARKGDVKKMHVEGGRTLSIDHQGRLLLLRKTDKGSVLTCLDASGKTLWETPVGQIGNPTHPPACGGDSRVYIHEGGALSCVREGETLWRREMPSSEYGIMMTVLSDNSVLAASLNKVHHISAEGETLASVPNPFVLTCRPVADEQGNVFVAGDEEIRCVR